MGRPPRSPMCRLSFTGMAAKVRAAMSEEIMSQVTLSSIGGGDGLAVTENLTLPKVVDKKYWTQISWESDNEEAISISRENQNTADTLFNPYVGVVRRGEEDQTVILTAKFTFQYTNDVIGEEAPIELVNTFEVTVPAMDRGSVCRNRTGAANQTGPGLRG